VTAYIIIGVLVLVGLAFAGAALLVSRLVAPRFPDKGAKLEPYESGEVAIGSARVHFKIGYYLLALVFLVFDVEALFLFPAVVTLGPAREGLLAGIPPALIWAEVALFVAILGFALFYAHRKRALEWE
jgi:NADH:ubiquinone oxidoreductase subunit 3 (subunit A)